MCKLESIIWQSRPSPRRDSTRYVHQSLKSRCCIQYLTVYLWYLFHHYFGRLPWFPFAAVFFGKSPAIVAIDILPPSSPPPSQAWGLSAPPEIMVIYSSDTSANFCRFLTTHAPSRFIKGAASSIKSTGSYTTDAET